MVLENLDRKTFFIRDAVVSGPFFDPVHTPCRALFLVNKSTTLPVTVSIETSEDGGDADYWLPVPISSCDECDAYSIDLAIGGHQIIIFRPAEAYWRVILSVTIPEGVYCQVLKFSDAVEQYDRED